MIKERVSTRLKKALSQNQDGLENISRALIADEEPKGNTVTVEDDGIVTTIEEIEGYAIVKAIAREIIPGDRVAMRDAKSYCVILLDNNSRKPIVRLHFNDLECERIALMANKQEEQVTLNNLDEIYQYADKIKETIKAYDESGQSLGNRK